MLSEKFQNMDSMLFLHFLYHLFSILFSVFNLIILDKHGKMCVYKTNFTFINHASQMHCANVI